MKYRPGMMTILILVIMGVFALFIRGELFNGDIAQPTGTSAPIGSIYTPDQSTGTTTCEMRIKGFRVIGADCYLNKTK